MVARGELCIMNVLLAHSSARSMVPSICESSYLLRKAPTGEWRCNSLNESGLFDCRYMGTCRSRCMFPSFFLPCGESARFRVWLDEKSIFNRGQPSIRLRYEWMPVSGPLQQQFRPVQDSIDIPIGDQMGIGDPLSARQVVRAHISNHDRRVGMVVGVLKRYWT